MPIVWLKDRRDAYGKVAGWHHHQWGYLHPHRTIADVENELSKYENIQELPLMWLYVSGTEVVGTVELCADDMPTRTEFSPWLASLYADEGHREQGIGRVLAEHCIHEAKSRGFKELFLFTPDKEQFYLRLHFSVLERPIYHGHRVSIMRLSLE